MFIKQPFLHLKVFYKKLKKFLLDMLYIAFSRQMNLLVFLLDCHENKNISSYFTYSYGKAGKFR